MTDSNLQKNLFIFHPLITLFKAFDTAGRVDILLFSGKKRVALRANLNADVFLGGTRMNHFTAGAGDRRFMVFRVNFLFHHLLLKGLLRPLFSFHVFAAQARGPIARPCLVYLFMFCKNS